MKKIAILLVFLGGCASSETIYMHNAKTGQSAQCGPFTKFGNIPSANNANLAESRFCVEDYQRQGYERVPGPK